MPKHTKKRASERVCRECGLSFITGASTKVLCSPLCRVRAEAKAFAGIAGCWNWPKSKNPISGYGQLSEFSDGKRTLYTAHRISYEAHIGPISDGLFVLHHCDNPACFNPGHFFLGTQADNMADMDAKGRRVLPKSPTHWTALHPERVPRGADHHLKRLGTECLPRGEAAARSGLTEEDVRMIRRSTETLAALAQRFGVSQAALSKIRLRKTWRHIA